MASHSKEAQCHKRYEQAWKTFCVMGIPMTHEGLALRAISLQLYSQAMNFAGKSEDIS